MEVISKLMNDRRSGAAIRNLARAESLLEIMIKGPVLLTRREQRLFSLTLSTLLILLP